MTISRRQFGTITMGTLLASAALPLPLRAQDGPIRIGAVNPYSGAMAQYGDEVTRCYELAAKLSNDAGGVLGRQIEIVRGNATTPQESLGAVEQLIGRDKCDLLIGTYVSAMSNAASEGALNYDKLYWETNALAITLTERGLPNYARAGASSNQFAARAVEGVADIVAARLGKPADQLSIWVEHEDSAYGTSIMEEQIRLFKEVGVEPGVGAHSAKAIDVTDSVLRAKNAAPDVWITVGYVGDTNLLLRAARDQGFKPPVIMLIGVGDTKETLEALGAEYLEGVLLVSYPRPDVNPAYGPGAADFLKMYQEAFGTDPIAPQGMNAFVGMQILLEAIESAGSTDYADVIEAAAAMDKPEGSYATGAGVKFDDTMQNIRAFPVIAQWQGGTVKAVFPAEAVADGVDVVNLPRG